MNNDLQKTMTRMSFGEASRKVPKKCRDYISVMSKDPESLKYSFRLLRSYLPWNNSLKDQQPWLVFKAIEWLESHLNERMEVFEYGSGGSTLFIAKRVKSITSIEYDPLWHSHVVSEIEKIGLKNCNCRLFEPKPLDNQTNSAEYRSRKEDYEDHDFRKYVLSVEEANKKFDLVLIDGRSRISCLKHALPYVKNKGFLIFDNTERKRYQEAFKILEKYPRKDFSGACPYSGRLYRTSIWQIK